VIKQVKIGSVPYRIEYSSPVVSEEKDKVLWGEILQGKQLIKVDAEIGPEMQRVVLLHEVIHGLLLHCGLSNHEEEIAERLGYALDSFLQDNPEFVKLYKKVDREWKERFLTTSNHQLDFSKIYIKEDGSKIKVSAEGDDE
jgi:hypothetical protein